MYVCNNGFRYNNNIKKMARENNVPIFRLTTQEIKLKKVTNFV